MRLLHQLLLLCLAAACPAWAAFLSTERPVQLAYGQKSVDVVFESDTPITRAKPLCECTTVRVEGTRLTAHVDTGGFTQDVEKQIEATTAEGKTTKLTMRFRVPQALSLSARSLVWHRGGPATPKTLRITIPKGSPVHKVTEASISGEAFDYTPRVVKDGAEYCVDITPRSTDKKTLNRLIIKTDSAEPRYAGIIVYLSIQP